MSTPEPLPALDTVQLRQRLAGLIDHQAAKSADHNRISKQLAVNFCSALPMVFGESLDRMTMWDKIAAAVQAGFAKTASGDLDLFVQCVLETIQADPARAVACEDLTAAMDGMFLNLDEDHRQDFLQYFVTHLIPILVHARRNHRERIEGAKK